MEISRIEGRLDVSVSPDNSCSVLWLVPEEPEELKAVMLEVAKCAAMRAVGFVGFWERSWPLEAEEADIAQSSQLSAQYSIGETCMKANMFSLRLPEDSWFWSQFGKPIRPQQICAALLPANVTVPSGLAFSGSQLVISAAALQARPGSSYDYTLMALEQAYLAETVVAGGIAVTKLRAELLKPGIALTASAILIDRISKAVVGARAIEPLLVERSIYLGGNW